LVKKQKYGYSNAHDPDRCWTADGLRNMLQALLQWLHAIFTKGAPH
jgi:hypothetical protein